MKRKLLSFILLALMAFINIPRDIYHSCDVAVEGHHEHGLSFSEGHEDCLICEFTFSTFSNDGQSIFSPASAEYCEFQSSVISLHDHLFSPYCEGRAPPVLA